MNIRAGLLLAALCCASGNACMAQNGLVGPDGLYPPQPETSPPNRGNRRRANAPELKPSSKSEPTTESERMKLSSDVK